MDSQTLANSTGVRRASLASKLRRLSIPIRRRSSATLAKTAATITTSQSGTTEDRLRLVRVRARDTNFSSQHHVETTSVPRSSGSSKKRYSPTSSTSSSGSSEFFRRASVFLGRPSNIFRSGSVISNMDYAPTDYPGPVHTFENPPLINRRHRNDGPPFQCRVAVLLDNITLPLHRCPRCSTVEETPLWTDNYALNLSEDISRDDSELAYLQRITMDAVEAAAAAKLVKDHLASSEHNG